jgi:hypothetical protein
MSDVDLGLIESSQGTVVVTSGEMAMLPILLFDGVVEAHGLHSFINWNVGAVAAKSTATIRASTPILVSYADNRVEVRAEILQNSSTVTEVTAAVLLVDALPGTGESPVWRQGLVWVLRVLVLTAGFWLARGLKRRIMRRRV